MTHFEPEFDDFQYQQAQRDLAEELTEYSDSMNYSNDEGWFYHDENDSNLPNSNHHHY